jgi:YfiH family protein
MEFVEREFLFEYEDSEIMMGFGKKGCTLVKLAQLYPHFKFIKPKQTHGNTISRSNLDSVTDAFEADSHWTTEAKVAMSISTADCIPVLVYSTEPVRSVAAIHAGWRGVANAIVPKTIERLKDEGFAPETLQVWIGPHIHMESFEVQADVRDQILGSLPEIEVSAGLHWMESESTPGRLNVDLLSITQRQLELTGVREENIQGLEIDTFATVSFESFRRDKEKSQRQISFIVRK